jgi:RNA polymerase sigma-70 factor (ECF subfamily)
MLHAARVQVERLYETVEIDGDAEGPCVLGDTITGMLSELLLSRVSADLRASLEPVSDLESTLEAMVAESRAMWPDVRVQDQIFIAYVADRLLDEHGDKALSKIQATDLYVACACCLGDEVAFSQVNDKYLGDIAHGVKKIDSSQGFVDEVLQRLRAKVFTSEGDALPKVVNFSGRGSFRAWLRVAAMRIAMDMTKKAKREVELSDTYSPGDGNRIDVEYLKQQYAQPFKEALSEALTHLSGTERTLLRMAVIDGLNTTELSRVYKIHRSTAARRLAKVQDRLAILTRERLCLKVELPVSELESIIGLVRSRVDLSVERFLRLDSAFEGRE